MSKKLGVEMAGVIVDTKEEFEEALKQRWEKIVISRIWDEYLELDYRRENTNIKELSIESGKVILRGNIVAHARGESQIVALDKTVVRAHDDSRVIAENHSKIFSFDKSKVIAYGFSDVEASGRSKVVANSLSIVRAYNKSKIVARGSSVISAYDYCRVTAFDAARVEKISKVAKIEIHDFASLI